MKNKKCVLILGVTGMLGSTVFRYLSLNENYSVFGAARNLEKISLFPTSLQKKIFTTSIGINNLLDLESIVLKIKPDIVINCIGIIKQSPLSDSNKTAIEINALLPHLIAESISKYQSKLIHISTDCVFSGIKGGYREFDESDARDIYGKSKFLGEISYGGHLTIRTSIIGHEMGSALSLLEWFLSQRKVDGYLRAIYSGVTTLELAKILEQYVLPAHEMRGLFHISSKPISKFELLSIVNKVYQCGTQIMPENNFVIDRSLDSLFFQSMTGYKAKNWEQQILELYKFNQSNLLEK
jgi:dTDP-4-dehydrorhamnose reductase